MVDVEVIATAVRAVDRGGNEVEIETRGWDRPAPETGLSFAPDAKITGRTHELVFPWEFTFVRVFDGAERLVDAEEFGDDRGTLQLDEGRYEIQVSTSPRASLRFDGAATLRRLPDRELSVSFPHPTAVTVGFRSLVSYPEQTVTVPATPHGVATALSQLPAALRTTGVDATTRFNRRHPPRVAFGEQSIPEAVREQVPETGVEFAVPGRLDVLFPLAPLAYYLAATVTVEERERPALRAPDTGLTHEFAPPPTFQLEAAALLRRVFGIDSAIHFSTEGAKPIAFDVFEPLALDVEAMQTAPPAERVRTYLELPAERIDPVLPEWPYVEFVEPNVEHARAIPYVLDRLGGIFTPDASTAADDDRHASDEAGELPRVRPPDPAAADVRLSPSMGWLSSSPAPANAFRSFVEAYENGPRYVERQSETDRIIVVGNDPDRTESVRRALESYRDRPSFPLEVQTRESLPRAELSALFEEGAAFVHFVGGCAGGLTCPDGILDPADLPVSNARAFFLDAPNSADEGAALLRAGSAAGLVRPSGAALSAAFERALVNLLATGFSLHHAVQYARRYVEDEPLRAIGDGNAQLVQSPGLYPIPYRVEPLGNGAFAVRGHAHYPVPGLAWSPRFPGSRTSLNGTEREYTADVEDLRAMLSEPNALFVYEDELHWGDDVEAFYPLA